MNLLNPSEPGSEYENNRKLYYEHLLEQYRIYVDSAHKISSRRNEANAFFLSLNTAILTILGGGLKLLGITFEGPIEHYLVVFPIFLCLVWWSLIRSYRKLNTAKFKVIGEFEKVLPASPFWNAEWGFLDQGKKITTHIPLTRLEQIVPWVFILFYLIVMVQRYFPEWITQYMP